jgi:hypothetical protein
MPNNKFDVYLIDANYYAGFYLEHVLFDCISLVLTLHHSLERLTVAT